MSPGEPGPVPVPFVMVGVRLYHWPALTMGEAQTVGDIWKRGNDSGRWELSILQGA